MEAVIKDNDGKVLATVALIEKTFKTGSVGYHGIGKVEIDDHKYQINFMMVEIGSKFTSDIFLDDLRKRLKEAIE